MDFNYSVVKIIYNPNENELNNIIAVAYIDGIIELFSFLIVLIKLGIMKLINFTNKL